MRSVKRIYVCSPYTELKKKGDAYVRHAALVLMRRANAFYECERVELFSPVLTNMYQCEHMTHDEAMQICFAQLRSCDEIFISAGIDDVREIEVVLNSKGIRMEYEFAKKNGIKISFCDIFLERLYENGAFHAKA